MPTSNLVNNCMVINVSISLWEGRRLDRAITRKTTTDAHASDDALRVNKSLVSKESFKEVQAASSAVRTLVHERTLPWKDNGDRLLLRAGYTKFIEDFHALEQDWAAAVDHFISVRYPEEQARASFRLGAAFDAEDYPHPEELRGRFRLSLGIDAVSTAQDFRVKLDGDTVSNIRSQIEEATAERMTNAMRAVWERIEKVVTHFASRTTGEVERFHESTVTNLQELVELLPTLNLVNDPNLAGIAATLQQTLCAYDPKTLRKDVAVRAAANAEAQEIIDTMAGFMSAWK